MVPLSDTRASSILEVFDVPGHTQYTTLYCQLGQVSLTFGRGTAVGRLLKVYSTARHGLLDPTEGIGIGSLCLPSPQ